VGAVFIGLRDMRKRQCGGKRRGDEERERAKCRKFEMRSDEAQHGLTCDE